MSIDRSLEGTSLSIRGAISRVRSLDTQIPEQSCLHASQLSANGNKKLVSFPYGAIYRYRDLSDDLEIGDKPGCTRLREAQDIAEPCRPGTRNHGVE